MKWSFFTEFKVRNRKASLAIGISLSEGFYLYIDVGIKEAEKATQE